MVVISLSLSPTHAAGSDLNPRSVRAGHGFYFFVFHVPEGAVGVHVDYLPSTVSHVFFNGHVPGAIGVQLYVFHPCFCGPGAVGFYLNMVTAALNVGPGPVGVVNFYPGFVGAADGVVRARARFTGLIIIGESS